MITLTLTRPVLDARGQKVGAVTLIEPTARQVLEIGNPWALAPYTVDRDGVVRLLAQCLVGVPYDTFADMAHYRDALAAEAALRGFFAPPGSTDAAPAASATEPSPSTT